MVMGAMAMKEERYLTIDQIATRLGVHRNTVRSWIHERGLKATRPGGYQYRIKESDLERFLEENQPTRREPEACI